MPPFRHKLKIQFRGFMPGRTIQTAWQKPARSRSRGACAGPFPWVMQAVCQSRYEENRTARQSSHMGYPRRPEIMQGRAGPTCAQSLHEDTA